MTHNFSFIFPFLCLCGIFGASLVAQLVKNMPAVQETCVQSLGWEDPLKKEMATHSSILVWEISWPEEPGGLQSMGLQKSDKTGVTKITTVGKQIPVLRQ